MNPDLLPVAPPILPLEDDGPILTPLECCRENAKDLGLPPQAEDEEEEHFMGRIRLAVTNDIINHAIRVRDPDWRGDEA